MENKIYFSKYRLSWKDQALGKSKGASREGALIRVEGGYADLHPWPELGDENLETQLELLCMGRPSLLGRRSLYYADLDSRARRAGQSLFKDLGSPKSHFLWDEKTSLETLRAEGFEKLKIKVSAQRPIQELKQVLTQAAESGFRLRLDANFTFSESTATEFFGVLGENILNAIEFVEDPFPFEDSQWRRFSEKFKLALAWDQKASIASLKKSPEVTQSVYPFEYLVIKDAVEDPGPWVDLAHENLLRVVFSSYLGHPMGHAASAFTASQFYSSHPLLLDEAGLLGYRLFVETAYSLKLSQKGPEWQSPGGTGLGFDAELANEQWIPL